ncbi:peptidoglycan DD-metalloendopeptidase family protein [Sulfitobacter sp. F26204]|uniref:peptidoglycan DD-metalloendopeptidase family protein n=1 Tax=Sulfitobacter sp. F26204 TaxID=2996014 RepID=UPI00225DCFE3|nr:peptidoglycan DD-metalloendopeptidase family protein [Sulfitobacter sp. F26204]MCX7558830.1 peptidoglycan DD-metalloendopeptidase family protein [Sulfitobacter sp. F26204]
MIRQGLLALSFPFACTAMAEGLTLHFPVDCVLGDSCYIQQFMDRDPGEGFRDFHCAALSYDGHKGTDFALPTRMAMEAGVNVLAAADGRVRGFRDGMPDTGYSKETAAAMEGKECGNGVVLVHPGGWETQYCHMKQGSINIRNDQSVKAGDILGQIGLSGRAEFPHLHLSVRKGGKPVDPFDPDGRLTCDSPGDSSLWAETPPYQPGGIVDVGLNDSLPEYADVKAGIAAATTLSVTAPALVVYGFSFGTQKDDVVRLEIKGPSGVVLTEERRLKRRHAQAFRAVGKRLRRHEDWPAGTYTGTATLLRNGVEISRQETEISIE